MTIVTKNSLTLSNVNDGTITHYAYAYSADGTDRFTTVYPNLNLLKGTKTSKSITGNNSVNQEGLLYSFDNNNTLVNQGFSVDDTITLEFDWSATNPASGSLILQWQGTPWGFNVPKINLSSTNGSGHVIYTCNIRNADVASTAVATGIGYRLDNVPTNTMITFSNVIIRKAKGSQPWMPSASEVTSADYPSHIGQYTDFAQSNSINPSDYTWSLIRGNDGQNSYTHTAYSWSADGKDGFTTVYPNINLVVGTKKPISEDGVITIGGTGGATTKFEYVPFVVDDNQVISNGMRITDDGSKTGQTQSGWSSGSKIGYSEVKDKKVTLSAYVRNDSKVPINIGLQIGMSPNPADQADNAKWTSQYTVIQPNSGITKLSATLEIPDGMVRIWYYIYTNRGSGVVPTAKKPYIWSFAGYKAEWGSKATPWMPAESEYATEWSSYYPRYVGYSDTKSEHPEDYQWVLNPEWVQASSDNGLADKASSSELQAVSDIANDAFTRAENSVSVDDYTSWLEHDYQTTIDSMREVSDKNKADITSINGRQTIVEGFYDNMKVKWNFIDESFTFGEEGMFISNSQSQMAIQIASDKIVFWDNNVDVAFITGEFLNIKKGVFLESATIGNHLITKFSDGSPVTIIRYIGGDN